MGDMRVDASDKQQQQHEEVGRMMPRGMAGERFTGAEWGAYPCL